MLLLPALLEHSTSEPERPALLSSDGNISYGQLARAVAGVAKALAARGLGSGDRVVFECPNEEASVVLYFGIHAAGCVAVPIEAGSDKSLAFILRATAPKLLVGLEPPEGFETAYCTAEELANTPGDPAAIQEPSDGDPADILFTTGTTADPKGVVLSHRNIAAAALNISTRLGQTRDDREVVPIPLSHSFGLGRVRCMALVGSAIALLPGMRAPKQIFEAIEEFEATGLALVPSGFAYLRRIAPKKLAEVGGSFRYVEIGSAAIDAATKDWLKSSLPNARLLHHYGLTEASRAAFVDLHSEASARGSIGKASPNVEIDVRSPDRTSLVDEVGELWVRGEMVMREYLGNPELTAKTLVDGWLRTNDLGLQDKDGWLVLRGRQSDTINVGGLKVAPQEVEEYLCKFPAIREAACVAMDDPNGISGQRVRAFVVADDGFSVRDVLKFLRGKKLEAHKLPAQFHVIDELPRTASGKLKRAELREREDVPAAPRR